MIELLSFILVCYGLTQILVFADVFNSIRPKYHFFHCPMCIGFWVGVVVCYFMFSNDSIDLVLHGGLSSGTSYALCILFGDQGINVRTYKN